MNISPVLEESCINGKPFTNEEILKETEKNMRLIHQEFPNQDFIYLACLVEDFSYFMHTKTGICFKGGDDFNCCDSQNTPYHFNADLSLYSIFSFDAYAFLSDQFKLRNNVSQYNVTNGGQFCDFDFYHTNFNGIF